VQGRFAYRGAALAEPPRRPEVRWARPGLAGDRNLPLGQDAPRNDEGGGDAAGGPFIDAVSVTRPAAGRVVVVSRPGREGTALPRPTRGAQSRSLYSVHPGVAMTQKWVAELRGKTGKSLEEWLALVRSSPAETDRARVAWLKENFGLGTNAAKMMVDYAAGKGTEVLDADAYLRAAEANVDAMFAGPRVNLRPIYDRLLGIGLGLGDDVRACPCKTIVPLYRRHVFAEIKPATRTRIDLGFCLRNASDTKSGRLVETGGLAKGDRITHKIGITSLDDIDDEVLHWLRISYELDG
jgi:hypothetical protein